MIKQASVGIGKKNV